MRAISYGLKEHVIFYGGELSSKTDIWDVEQILWEGWSEYCFEGNLLSEIWALLSRDKDMSVEWCFKNVQEVSDIGKPAIVYDEKEIKEDLAIVH